MKSDMTEKKSTTAAAAKGAEKIAARKAKKAAKAADPERIAKKEALARSKKKATKRNADKIAEANAAEAAAAKGGKAAKALTQAEQTALEIKTIVQAAEDKKAKRIVSMDLRSIGTSICDYFVICNADSTTNVLAIADNIEDELIVKCKRQVLRSQGKENAFWIILDFGDIVVHIFQTEYREFYRLEDLWADATITEYQNDEE